MNFKYIFVTVGIVSLVVLSSFFTFSCGGPSGDPLTQDVPLDEGRIVQGAGNLHLSHKGNALCSDCHSEWPVTEMPFPNCAECHEFNDMHETHILLEFDCIDCHPGGYGSEPEFDECINCHTPGPYASEILLHPTHDGSADCADCHVDGTNNPPDFFQCQECHGGYTEIHSHHLPNMGCEICHEGGYPNPPQPAICAMCHMAGDPPVPDNDFHQGHSSFNCLTCHTEGTEDPPDYDVCTSCHDGSMTHGEHDGILVCLDCHNDGPGNGTNFQNCWMCHGEADPWHEIHISQKNCSFCHPDGAGTEPDYLACLICHDPPTVHEPHVTVMLMDCLECHDFHDIDFTPPDRELCEACHVDKTEHYLPYQCWECHAQ